MTRLRPSVLGADTLEASFERDAGLRAARPAVPSTSQTLYRCANCRAWCSPAQLACGTCGASVGLIEHTPFKRPGEW